MPWPTDPLRQQEAKAKMRASSALRWSDPANRERARQNAIKQFADPAQREKMREIKRLKALDPEHVARVTAHLAQYRHLGNAAKQAARADKKRAEADRLQARLQLLKERALARKATPATP